MMAFLMLFSLAVASVQRVWAAPTCILEESVEEYDLRPYMEFLEDTTGNLTIGQAASETLAGRYGPPPKGHFNFGFTSSALWFRFTVAETPSGSEIGKQSPLWILDPGWHLYDTIHLYVPRPEAEGGWQVYAAGRLLSVPGEGEKRHRQIGRAHV